MASGWDIDSFGERGPASRKARAIPAEASAAKALVGLIQISRLQCQRSFEIFVGQLAAACEEMGISNPEIEEAQWRRIDERTLDLPTAYAAIGRGETLELDFV